MQAYRTAATALRRAVWDPFSSQLSNATHVFIVPDGQLNIVNIAALPNKTGRFLVEGGVVLHYLSTERDLVPLEGQTTGRGLFAVGGAAFGNTSEPSAATSRGAACESAGNISFAHLPGSRREVLEIGKVWPESDVVVLSGREATESAVKKAVAGQRVVHLATHGFVLGSDCSPSLAGSRSIGGLTTAVRANNSAAPENPLLLSGLAFAGANHRRTAKADQDDGILTAEEIGTLNLQGTEWAVLSACDTGLGEIKAGEGVFGLRRAFQIAGARTVIMSLWSVDDRAAMAWMRALYDGRLRQNMTTADAVRAASLSVLRERRARGLSVHPFFWAGFVASGDWR